MLVGAAFTASAQPPEALPGRAQATDAPQFTEGGLMAFESKCLSCHGNPAYDRAPSPQALRAMPPERIYEALTTGPMKFIGDTLSDKEKRQIAESTAGRLMGSGVAADAKSMPNRCAANPPLTDPAKGPAWNGWSADAANTRFQPASAGGLTAADMPKLKLKWAFGLPGSSSAYSQPTVVSGRVFVGADTGWIYSLDAETGCVHWSFQAKAGVRNAIVVGAMKDHGRTRYAAFFGDLKANVYAVDAQTGEELWTRHVDDHVAARVTASPALYGGRLFVPLSAWEGSSARTPDYPCCTFQGSVVALDVSSGRELWKHYTFHERPTPVRKNSKGVQLYAPAGGPVWNTPTIDPRRGAVYYGTGDASTYPSPPTTDSVIAVSMTTGKTLWTYQVHKDDASLVGCWGQGVTENCPKVEGPDWDVPGSPILRTLKGGRRVLVIATKPGDVLAVDPDRKGALVWRKNINGPKLALTLGEPFSMTTKTPFKKGMLFGGAADHEAAYFGLTGGGMAAVDLATGDTRWMVPLDAKDGARVSYPAAASAIPGAALVAGDDGRLLAVSTADGSELWGFDTARPFDTVNKVEAHGGSMGSAGPTVAGGMVFVGSGYAITFGKPGNVLLAFAR
ncbi:MAG: PQQ-binding-like beta-propeller repeat protein [Caulobacteraceae bacterium]